MAESNRPNWYLIIGVGALVTVAGFAVRALMRHGLQEVLFGEVRKRQAASEERELGAARSEYERWLALTRLTLDELDSKPASEVRAHANEVLTIAAKYQNDWNYGNAIHKGNLALGRLALREGKVDEAGKYLLLAGHTPGSPQLNTFGPNMSLAKELLERGERQKVLEYFELCAKFWKQDRGQLKIWSLQVKGGAEPAFGANLLY